MNLEDKSYENYPVYFRKSTMRKRKNWRDAIKKQAQEIYTHRKSEREARRERAEQNVTAYSKIMEGVYTSLIEAGITQHWTVVRPNDSSNDPEIYFDISPQEEKITLHSLMYQMVWDPQNQLTILRRERFLDKNNQEIWHSHQAPFSPVLIEQTLSPVMIETDDMRHPYIFNKPNSNESHNQAPLMQALISKTVMKIADAMEP